MKIGFFGGTFNPIHNAHIKISKEFAIEAELDKVIFIPAFVSPFKIGDPYYFHIDTYHRVKMVQLAIANIPGFEMDDFEIRKGGVSFTFDTVNYLKQNYSDDRIYMLIGSDQAAFFDKWKNWMDILKNVQLCIATRPNTLKADEKAYITKLLSVEEHVPVWLNTPLMPVSSSNIRNMIKNGEDASPFLPEKVYKYIKLNELYSTVNT